VPRRKRQKNKAKAAEGGRPVEEEAGDSGVEQTNGDASSTAPAAGADAAAGAEDEVMAE
jgi:hypothetical protein